MEATITPDLTASTVEETQESTFSHTGFYCRLAAVCTLLVASFFLSPSLVRVYFIMFLLGNTMFFFSEYQENLPEKSSNLFLKKESQFINTLLVSMACIVSIIAIAQRLPLW